ncbi:polysulfide reductase [Micractinium conductrix]|uniref:Polysulfide reductase n=1 Tax=Micractinium conductrix TaxID=554055 RepID=A0A2P6VQW5_9CHLO|nr:polysulfide reductase [Micractinium conductrix]|eukprot:PSC76467.1 polysulfide reductase [Micractinium conductrix]
MKSGGGVLLVATLQLAVGMSLLGVYEGFKTHYFNNSLPTEGLPAGAAAELVATRAFYFHTPLDYLFWFSAVCAVCALFGLAGIFTQQPTLVTLFFAYNLMQSVVSFNFFVDVVADQKIRFVGEAAGVTGYEKAAAGLLFTIFVLSLASVYFTTRAVAEIKQKQKEVRYHEMSAGMSDALHFEPDV